MGLDDSKDMWTVQDLVFIPWQWSPEVLTPMHGAEKPVSEQLENVPRVAAQTFEEEVNLFLRIMDAIGATGPGRPAAIDKTQ